MSGSIGRAAIALLAVCCLISASGCAREFEILAPLADGQIADDGTVTVEIDLGSALGEDARVFARLVSVPAGARPTARDVSDRLEPIGGFAGAESLDAQLSPADGVAPGVNWLVVTVVRGDGAVPEVATRLFVWAPGIDLAAIADADLDRCDPTGGPSCLYPFPNDYYTVEDDRTDTGRRVSLAIESMPANRVTGVRIDPTEWNRSDGFSPGSMIVTRIPGIDLGQTGAPPIQRLADSLDPSAPFALVDAETGERQLFWAEVDTLGGPGSQALILRPGKNLQDGRRYVVGLARPRDGDGLPIEARPAFRLYRDRISTLIPEIEARRPAMESIFETLAAAGLAREDLVQAWDFTVISKRNMSERLLAMRDDAFASLDGAAPAFQVTEVRDDLNEKILRRVYGTFEVPLYLDNDGRPGARLEYGLPPEETPLDHLPVRAGDGTASYTANFLCVIPRSASADGGAADAPARISLYGHGLLGSAGETGASHVADMANDHNFIFCGTDSIGMAEDDVEFGDDPSDPPPWITVILNDLSLFPTLADRLHQAILNNLFLGRLMMHPDGLASDPAFRGSVDDAPFIDGRHLFYDGNSQGGILGGAIAAFSTDLRRAVLGVPGMNYSTLLRRSVDFDDFLILLDLNYRQRDHSLGISLIQMLWDRVEANGHANHLTHDPYPGTPAKQILLHVAWGDFQVANVTTEVEARTIGAAIHRPALEPESRHWEAEPFYGIPTIEYPHDGSALVYWDSGNLTPPSINQPPRERGDDLGPCAAGRGGDPHECPRREPAARLQKSEFLRQDVDENDDGTPDRDGQVISVCGEVVDGDGLPTGELLSCLAP